MEPIFSQVTQVALVVKDVEAVAKAWADKYGITGWNFWDFGPENQVGQSIHGKEETYRYKQAATYIGTTHFELIQPLDDKSIYAEFLKEHGEGLHHIAFATDHDKAVERFAEVGKPVMQQGCIMGQHTFSYIDCTDDLKMIVEFNKEKPGFTMPEPRMSYPEK